MKVLAACISVALLAGCATVRYADGEHVALEHPDMAPQSLQVKADALCTQSGGHAPAKLVSNVSGNPSMPLTRMVATFRCS